MYSIGEQPASFSYSHHPKCAWKTPALHQLSTRLALASSSLSRPTSGKGGQGGLALEQPEPIRDVKYIIEYRNNHWKTIPYLNKKPTNTKKTLDWVKGAKEGWLCPRDGCWCEFTLKTLLHTQAYHGSLRFIRNFWPKQGHQQFITSLTKVAFWKTGKIFCHWFFQILIQLQALQLFQKPVACELLLFQGRLCHCITGQTSKSSILNTRNYDNDP